MRNPKQPTSHFSLTAKLFAMGCSAMATCATFANVINLCTKTGQSLSLGLSDYTYEEREVMSLKANKLGFTYTNTYAFDHNNSCLRDRLFLSGQIHYANGKADYFSPISGSLNDTANWYVRSNLLVGKDYLLGAHILSPYIGLGFRYLHNDLRTNDFRQGYRRNNFLVYIPVGITHKTAILNKHILSTTIEYNHLLRGVQKSSLSDQNPTAKNVALSQSKGQGFRFEVMVKKNDWAFGPSVNYWRIDQSNIISESGIHEPKNATTEIELKITKFF